MNIDSFETLTKDNMKIGLYVIDQFLDDILIYQITELNNIWFKIKLIYLYEDEKFTENFPFNREEEDLINISNDDCDDFKIVSNEYVNLRLSLILKLLFMSLKRLMKSVWLDRLLLISSLRKSLLVALLRTGNVSWICNF